MALKTLSNLFDEFFQGEYDFEDFLGSDLTKEVVQKVFDSKATFIASPKLRAYHRFLRHHVIRSLDINMSVVFSYRREVNVVDALRKHSGGKCFFQTDLNDFFSSIDRDLVVHILSRNSARMSFSGCDRYINRLADLMTFSNIVPRGFSTSPSLSNACLVEFDNEFLKYCQINGLIYTRYSDDIVVSGQSEEDVKTAGLKLIQLLSGIYNGIFSINKEKSKFVKVGRKIKLLGMVILPNGSVSIELSVKRKIESLLHFYSTDSFKFLDVVDDDLEKGKQMLAGYVNFANAVDKIFLDKLRKKYGAMLVDDLLHMG